MATSASIQNIDRAESTSHAGGEFCAAFDSVMVTDTSGGYIVLFFPSGTGEAVADAINAAIPPAIEDAA